MTTLPDKPQVTNSEVVAALLVAHELGWVKVTSDQEHGVVHHRMSEMEMLQVLEAAFNHRHERFNGELRREAQRLDRHMALARIQTKKYEEMQDVVRWAQGIRDHVERLLKLLETTRVVRISDEYSVLRALLDQNHDVDTAP